MEIVKFIAIFGLGISIGQLWVHFALREFMREHGINGDDKTQGQ